MENSLKKIPDELIEIIEQDRQQSLMVIAGEILRRVKNPLEVIRGRSEALHAQLDFQQREQIQGILDQLFHLENLIKSIENLLLPSVKVSKPVHLFDLVQEIILFFHPRLAQAKIQVLNLLPPDLTILAPPDSLKQIIRPIFLNAIEALEVKKNREDVGRTIFVQYQQVKSYGLISIEDNGEGVSMKEVKSFFLAGHSRKADHVGLSLSICKKICQHHGWELKAFSQKGQGTRLELWIPQSSCSSSLASS